MAASFAADSAQQKLWLGLPRSGLWRSQNGGQQWTAANADLSPGDKIGLFSVTSADAAGDTVIMRVSTTTYHSQIWYSFDSGENWNHFPDGLLWAWPGDLMIFWRADHQVLLHRDMQVFHRSTDAGQSWVTFPLPFYMSGSDPTSLSNDTIGDSTLFLTQHYFFWDPSQTSYGGLGRSEDLGEHWSLAIDFHQLFGIDDAFVQGVLRLTNGHLLVLVLATIPSWENGTLLVSSDDGATWNRIFGGLPDRFQPKEAIEDPQQPGTLLIIGGQKYGVYWSHDFGQTWTRCLNGLPANVAIANDLFLEPFSGAIYAAFSGYGVFVTHDHGESWQPVLMPDVGCMGTFGVTAETVFERDDGYRAWRLNPGAEEWTEMAFPLSPDTLVMVRPICYQNGSTMVTGLWKRNTIGAATDVFQMIHSSDDGATWQLEPFLPFLPNYFDVYRSVEVTRFLDIAATELRWSENLGHLWNVEPLPSRIWPTGDLAQDDSAIFVTAWDTQADHPEVFRTTDVGMTWQALGFVGSDYNHPPMPTVVGGSLLVISNGQTWWWQSGSWQQRGTFPQHESAAFLIPIPLDDRTLLFGTSFYDNKAWFSADTGATWSMSTIELPFQGQSFGFTDLRWDEPQQRVWAVAALGMCYLDVADLSTTGPLQFIPADFTALSCYPNPFNSETTIRFDLEQASELQLDVFDLTGRRVRSLWDGPRTAGRHEMEFRGENLPSGTYFVRLTANQHDRVQKILLLK